MGNKTSEKQLKYMRDRYRNNPDVREKAKMRSKAQRDSFKDGFWSVYYLPEEHYVGISCEPENRIYRHGYYQNKITEGWEILGKFEREVDAHWFETMLHMRGYNGYHKQSKK